MVRSRSAQTLKFLTFSIPVLLLACSLFFNQGDEKPETVIESTSTSASPEPEIATLIPISTPNVPAEVVPTQVNSIKIVAVSTNSNRNLAIDTQGRVWEWGTYETGPANSPCKRDGIDCKLLPSLVPGLEQAMAVSTGYEHNLALKKDGTVWAWGHNFVYALGQGTVDSDYHKSPLQVPGLNDIVAISASSNFNLALRTDGSVWAWGENDTGQVGDGKDSYTPDYGLYEEVPFQVVNIGNITAVDTGWTHSLGLAKDGTLWSWGHNQLGELGQGTADTDQHPVPKQVSDLGDSTARIGAGYANSIVIRKDGSVWAWGANLGGQLCDGQMSMQPFPNPVELKPFQGAVQVEMTSMQSLALMPDGTVWACGILEGIPNLAPGQVPGLDNVVYISGGEDHAVALKKDGSLWAWGFNTTGQLGDGTQNNRSTPGLVLFPAQ
jgi:alpha-tubulin suppressor-like RCC1 family protein